MQLVHRQLSFWTLIIWKNCQYLFHLDVLLKQTRPGNWYIQYTYIFNSRPSSILQLEDELQQVHCQTLQSWSSCINGAVTKSIFKQTTCIKKSRTVAREIWISVIKQTNWGQTRGYNEYIWHLNAPLTYVYKHFLSSSF
jgi:hypothetical protein